MEAAAHELRSIARCPARTLLTAFQTIRQPVEVFCADPKRLKPHIVIPAEQVHEREILRALSFMESLLMEYPAQELCTDPAWIEEQARFAVVHRRAWPAVCALDDR